MHIHILGICGTFMGSLAVLAKQMGFEVTGSDQGVYPPMSTQLESQGIKLMQGYDPKHLQPHPDMVVIGNAMSRGNPAVEYVLNQGLDYVSGPEWLARYVLRERWTLAVAGTHGKTTTSTMLAWILDYAGMAPGFLIGGVPQNFSASARLGESSFFVVEADEYDSAFFDKRSKFVHYRPRTLIINNVEFDHADIFPDLDAIQTQFHHCVRTVPGIGQVIYPAHDAHIQAVLDKGCWAEQQPFVVESESESGDWNAQLLQPDGSHFLVSTGDCMAKTHEVEVRWGMTGLHNVSNGIAAMMAACHVGIMPEVAAQALCAFGGVKRRMELLSQAGGLFLYDDFAHHPTAIKTTLDGLRKRVGESRIVALIEPRSNTMKMGVHQTSLLPSAEQADHVIWANLGGLGWLEKSVAQVESGQHELGQNIDELLALTENAVRMFREQDPEKEVHVVVMSNGGFGGIHEKLSQQISKWA
ncbi:UDP-N-acetylmuramate:L-alanyl-gamma-D-glutamyl- meso-diaminopimelate ligase [Oleiphilus messinensis]|uniref:UDP-N-acetylmuramate--L-alanyl-gamma-D-glutamyl-meso-2,6-diaminoheptandioate ligase n=1 Tax=Oleiphilus messinensis TaxID=141451 RepID=A0A1Y0ICX9_9GAMM|nr:UDP-N-acetylmuramate:L-alanyl-gamma-D-glutamyl-meso-diaminopimelate ligase [Oleiphilus messinensis]ARU58110.1 UDP-N-acetylmuramate:L-alanyl-gamma-D-glutamyl- meso-diaminopimelate ligase [Oleiphilus messinensis]